MMVADTRSILVVHRFMQLRIEEGRQFTIVWSEMHDSHRIHAVEVVASGLPTPPSLVLLAHYWLTVLAEYA